MLEMLKKDLASKGAFTSDIPEIIVDATKAISTEASYKMKLLMATTEIMVLTSHLRKPIELDDGTLVPVNLIVFILAASGLSKDSSMQTIRRILKPSYNKIEAYRKELAQSQAKHKAVLDGKAESDWLSYYSKPRDLFTAVGTLEGQMAHLASLEKGEVGAGFISESELGSALQTNKNLIDNIIALSIGYDLGKIGAKLVKSDEAQTESIESLPFSGLFFGSQDTILYDNSVKVKFKSEFNTKLARRSFFNFNTEIPTPLSFSSVAEMVKYKKGISQDSIEVGKKLMPIFEDIVETTTREPLRLTDKARYVYEAYFEYNSILSLGMSAKYPMAKLARKHTHWKTQKLAGCFAILDKSDMIDEKHYIQAINFSEMFTSDLVDFEDELVKEPYEIFCEFCKHNAEEGKYSIGLHALRKLGYISTTGSPKSKIEELVHLASSYDREAIYTVCVDNGICYEEIVRTDKAGLSYLAVTGTKGQRSAQCASGYEFYEADFSELGGMIAEDYAYSPFRFVDGVRGKENIIGGCKFIALDIDQSSITDEECHLLLEGINHHIARTSDPENKFKFRVLVELDSIVDIEDRQWRYFLEGVGQDLGLNVDLLPKSQIYFAYEGREVLSELEGEPLETRHLIINASEKVANKPVTKKMSTAQQKALLDDKLGTFGFAFNAESGEGSRSLVRAGLYAVDLGATQEYVEGLVLEINKYWVEPMDDDRLESTVLNYLRRKF